MKCVLLFAGSLSWEGANCLEEECAWWDEKKGCCLLRTLTLQVNRLADIAKGAVDKMSHSGQFTK